MKHSIEDTSCETCKSLHIQQHLFSLLTNEHARRPGGQHIAQQGSIIMGRGLKTPQGESPSLHV